MSDYVEENTSIQSKTRIFIAEDDARLAHLVQAYLQRHGFETCIEENGGRVIRAIHGFEPDLVILDVMLPEKDGLSICKDLRPVFDGPILMLTARDSDIDQVLGLDYGADDYVIKPAEPQVLLARIKALLRRCNNDVQTFANDKSDFEFGRLKIQPSQRLVYVDDQECDLSSHEYDLLTVLVKNAGKVLSREMLLNTVYQRSYDGLDRTIDVRVSHLRKKLGDSTENPRGIKTIWGKGYLFVAEGWGNVS